MSDYDIISIGGGLGGASLAKAMAERGARVLVVERETKFKDRVRGEGMTPWGVAEAQALGIYDVLASSCGHQAPWWDNFIGPMQVVHREMPTTTPQGTPTLCFYHPAMQQRLIEAAESAGAEVRSGARVTAVTPGATPSVTVERDGAPAETLTARLVVGADGRNSPSRKAGRFEEHREKDRLLISGLLFENCAAPDDTVRFVSDFQRGRSTILFPQGKARARMYLIYTVDEGMRLQGEKDIPRFVQESVTSGMPDEYCRDAVPAGPLATFDGAASWVSHPYADGLALIGDAAGSSDPSWGQGLSLTVRDARVLRDALLANDDWDAAGHAYATERTRYFENLHQIELWGTQFFYDTGPEGDVRRAQALPLIAQDPTRQPDAFFSGPDEPATETMRRRFFGEE